ncbi:unnamed protein product [Paramecium octaurelia]|uniref:Uncharacterized protein n=1 Tax=Paramecium octaurelia TaxID=43137 RepID=A0A8S1VHV7_PAROT|nr:unnamed protein product [Paramecium octaurelia]
MESSHKFVNFLENLSKRQRQKLSLKSTDDLQEKKPHSTQHLEIGNHHKLPNFDFSSPKLMAS